MESRIKAFFSASGNYSANQDSLLDHNYFLSKYLTYRSRTYYFPYCFHNYSHTKYKIFYLSMEIYYVMICKSFDLCLMVIVSKNESPIFLELFKITIIRFVLPDWNIC